MARTSVLVALVGLLGCSAPVAEPTPSAKPRASDEAPSVTPDDVVWVDRVTTASGEASDAEPLPLVVAVHGLGDAPDRFCRLFDDFRVRARVACPRAFSKHGKNGWSWFPPGRTGADQARDIAASADRCV